MLGEYIGDTKSLLVQIW